MKLFLAIVCLIMLSGCATGKMLQTEEGRKFIVDSPEIQEILKSEAGVERIEKWCAIDPLIRFAVRLELTAQKTYIPVLSDIGSCTK